MPNLLQMYDISENCSSWHAPIFRLLSACFSVYVHRICRKWASFHDRFVKRRVLDWRVPSVVCMLPTLTVKIPRTFNFYPSSELTAKSTYTWTTFCGDGLNKTFQRIIRIEILGEPSTGDVIFLPLASLATRKVNPLQVCKDQWNVNNVLAGSRYEADMQHALNTIRKPLLNYNIDRRHRIVSSVRERHNSHAPNQYAIAITKIRFSARACCMFLKSHRTETASIL